MFLTFDLDWACDEVLADTLDIVEHAGVPATWFVTHDTPLLDRMRRVPHWELGIHPNFNDLLKGDSRHGRSSRQILEQLIQIVPEARSVRSHSMTSSSRLLEEFQAAGLTHDVNCFVPSGSGVAVRPWHLWNGMVRLPYLWEDDLHCAYQGSDQVEVEPREIVSQSSSFRSGPMVFGFHPIHVFLNSKSLQVYEQTRTLHRQADRLASFRGEGNGTRARLFEILMLAG